MRGDEQGLAYDWLTRTLYILNRNHLTVCDWRGHYRSSLLNESVLQEATSIALDPFVGFLFITDWHYPPFVGRASLDGTRFTKIVTQDLGTPIGLTIDTITQRIFWTDTHLKRIDYSNYNGTQRRVAVAASTRQFLAYPFGLAFFDGRLFWSDRANHSIFAANALNGSNQTVIRAGTIHAAFALSVYHYSLQPTNNQQQQLIQSNPCRVNNGGCSHLCLKSADEQKKYTCACSNSFMLDTDGKRCIANCSEWHFRCGMPDERCIPFYWKCGKDCFIKIYLSLGFLKLAKYEKLGTIRKTTKFESSASNVFFV